ncbi:MAG: Group II intron-encoded protein LtrA [Syntrophomonadaceae bacterium]|nr:Group II intron-encoded protein LtrA [Bacillota bacterium]
MLSAKAGKVVSAEVQPYMETKLNLITKHATEDKSFKFSSLAHLLNVGSLKECFHMLKKGKAPGIDNVTYEEYEKYLNTNIQKLVKKMKAGDYYPQPVRRAYIPKGEGKLRPLGIPALEDKIVQMGITKILNAIFEPNFLECSYGFRVGRNCHQALKQLDNVVMTKPVNHVIDADIRSFFDNVDHDWLMKMLGEKIIDRNFLSIIKRFLKAGVMEEGILSPTDEGTPQGGIISPTLSNIYLHYVLDLWVEKAVKREMNGYVELVRYADDFVVLVQYKEEAEKIMEMLGERLNKFGLDLSKEKTRLIEFGRYAKINAERKGNFKVGRKTRQKKYNAKLKEMNEWLKAIRNMVEIKEWWEVLKAKLRGHYEYYGISGNYPSLMKYYRQTYTLAYKWINRRSQKKSMNWTQFVEYIKQFPLPKPEIKHNIYVLGGNV